MNNKTVKILEVACFSECCGVVKFLCDVLLYGVPGAVGISVLRWWGVTIVLATLCRVRLFSYSLTPRCSPS